MSNDLSIQLQWKKNRKESLTNHLFQCSSQHFRLFMTIDGSTTKWIYIEDELYTNYNKCYAFVSTI